MYDGLDLSEEEIARLIEREEILIYSNQIDTNFVGFYAKNKTGYYIINKDYVNENCLNVMSQIDKITLDLCLIEESAGVKCTYDLTHKVELIFNAKDLLKTN